MSKPKKPIRKVRVDMGYGPAEHWQVGTVIEEREVNVLFGPFGKTRTELLVDIGSESVWVSFWEEVDEAAEKLPDPSKHCAAAKPKKPETPLPPSEVPGVVEAFIRELRNGKLQQCIHGKWEEVDCEKITLGYFERARDWRIIPRSDNLT